MMRQLFTTKHMRALFVAFLLAAVMLVNRSLMMARTIAPLSSQEVIVTVDPNGAYTIVSQAPAWKFGGTLGRSLTDIAVKTGSDRIGSYQETVFNYHDQTGAPRSGGIRAYTRKSIVLFTDTYQSEASNNSPFPRLSTYPKDLYHLTYVYAFAQHSFVQYGADSPWAFFDAQANTFILSAASDFMIASTTKGTDGAISSGITTEIKTLPQGFTHKTFLAIGKGINTTYSTWGRAMTDLQGKTRPTNDADVILKTFGYWTTVAYYYHYDPQLGYHGTLLAVKDSFKKMGIPLGYMHLGSWFYPKGPDASWSDRRGGIYLYIADPTLFPKGLATFQRQLGLPLLTQAKYIDPSSPYHQQYKISNDMATDPQYWKTIAAYLKATGIITYEQDFLSKSHLPVTNLTDPAAFTDNMASAMAAQGISMMYCTELPRYLLQSSRYNNLIIARVSDDHFTPSKWEQFLYGSQLAGALGIWPYSDQSYSRDMDNLLLTTLSAGVVGVGDAIGEQEKGNILRVIRSDGVIVKPDVPIAPLDAVYVQDAKSVDAPMIASTYTDFGTGMKAVYVFAYARGTNTKATFTPASLGLAGTTYIYNYFTGEGKVVPAGTSYTDTVGSGSYYIVVPIGQSGIGFLGDAGKFVPLDKKRISQLTDMGTLQATITFASGETELTMRGYSPTVPKVSAGNGTVSSVTYNSSTHLFGFIISPGSDGSAQITISI